MVIVFVNPKPWNCDTCGKELDYWINLAKSVTCDECSVKQCVDACMAAAKKALQDFGKALGSDPSGTPEG